VARIFGRLPGRIAQRAVKLARRWEEQAQRERGEEKYAEARDRSSCFILRQPRAAEGDATRAQRERKAQKPDH